MSDESNDRLMVVLLAVGVEGGLVVMAWLLGAWLDHPPLRTFVWDWNAAWRGMVATLPLLLLFVLLMHWPVGPLRGIKRFTEEVLRPILMPCTLVDLIGIALLAGLGEEMVFRGVLQPAFEHLLGPWGALAAASVLFGVMHAVTRTYAVLATLMGAYFGGLLMLEGNLLVPVIVHGLYDLVVLLYLLRWPGAVQEGEPETSAAEGVEQPPTEN